MNVSVKLFFFVALASHVARSSADECVATILQPVSGEVLLGGPGFGSVQDTIDQESLMPMFVSGVTPFDGFMASHSVIFAGLEWFSNENSGAATLLYDLGEDVKIDAMAYWNEETNIVMDVRVSVSMDGVAFTEATTFMPLDNPPDQVYFNEVISFSPVMARYVKLEMTNCVANGANWCSVGEIAFRKSCAGDGGAFDDPHILSWSQKYYDYMGECDLVLVEAPHFAPGQSLSAHIRTTIRYDYSYIESAVVKIGDDTLEVGSFGQHWLNGVEGALSLRSANPKVSGGALSVGIADPELSGFPVSYHQKNNKTHIFRIEVAPGEEVLVRAFKDMVSVRFENADAQRFNGSGGLMGEFGTGRFLARDGETVLEDPNMFAAEWQVKDDESMLFESTRAPQYPQACRLPEVSTTTSRRLGDGSISLEAATKACSHWKENKEACIRDVMATGDSDLANAGW